LPSKADIRIYSIYGEISDAEESDVDKFHWINEHGFLTIADLAAIAREVWE
jgi:hypothetical protein